MVRKLGFALALVALLGAVSTGAMAQLSGAIFTSTATGTTVNGNIYDSKSDVYLNGGPQPNAPCTAAGLPNGDYYFQVTDPSGAVLLSTDDIQYRVATVSGGLITSAYNHAVGTGKCPGSVSVQLIPYLDTPNMGGEYKVWVTPVGKLNSCANSTFGFCGAWSKTDNFKVKERDFCSLYPDDPSCQPQPETTRIFGYKWYDANTNGQWDNAEIGIQDWKITIDPADINGSACTLTSTDGQYGFVVPWSTTDTYTIAEADPNEGLVASGGIWAHTTATSGTAAASEPDPPGNLGPNFGNVCVGTGGGLTLGFWSNKNGGRLTTSADLTFLSSLSLRNANGSNFDPTTVSQFQSWLLNGTAVNMANMLSVQLAAMEMNVRHGFVNGNALIYAPGSNSANSNGFATVNAIMSEANTELGLHAVTLSGSPYRSYQEALKNALDKANNNKTFVQATACAHTFTACN